MYFYLITISISFVILGVPYAQEQRAVAKIGNDKIYESEFKERFDFSIHPKLLQNSDKFAVKQEFLHQLIAEKLLAIDAREKGYNNSELFTNITTPLQNMYIRDALYNLEVKNKISYTQDEIDEGFERIKKLLKVNFIYSSKKEELQKIYILLKAGASFDSLLATRNEKSANPKEITFGSMAKMVEDSVYRLKPGEFTNPIESEDCFYILKLIDVIPNPDLKSPELVYDDVKRIVEKRAEQKRYLDFYQNFFTKYRITADKEIFENLVKNFIPEFEEKYSNQNSEVDESKYYLRGGEVSSILLLLDSATKEKTFISFSENPVKVGYFINQLSQDGFFVRDKNELSIRASLSSYIRKFIEDQLLTADGIKKGLENTPDVKKYMSMWEDYYLSKMLMANFFDSIKVSEEETYSIYKENDWKNNPLELVNIAEVLTDSLAVIETVLNELSKGANIKDLARQYTKRDSLKDRGGEFGFFSITQNGEIGRIASQMEIGDVYGPLELEEGYSVFQLIDKKEDTTSYSMSYDELREQLISHVTLLKFEKYVNEYNARLANKYGVEIYEDVLNDIDNIYMNLVVVRYMGFGGEIFAVPYTEEFSGWYDLWLGTKKLAQ